MPKEAGVAFSSALEEELGLEAYGQEVEGVRQAQREPSVVSAHCSGGSLGGDLLTFSPPPSFSLSCACVPCPSVGARVSLKSCGEHFSF